MFAKLALDYVEIESTEVIVATSEHLEVFKQGVDVWNRWRKANPNIIPQLESVVIKGPENSKRKVQSDLERIARSIRFESHEYVYFKETALSKIDLREARLNGSIFIDVDLSEADLWSAHLHGSQFFAVNLQGAILGHANFFMTEFLDVNFQSAKLFYTIFQRTNLSGARNLHLCDHEGSSIIDHFTILKSGNLPKKFLRGCGLPDSLIEYYPSLLNKPLEFYTCFISFTESDDLFAERLYNDLQGEGVRCWRWKEDAKIGHILIRSIDEAIREYDKLIVICSKESLKSPAVIREIERALQKEDKLLYEGRELEVLFPIRLDDFIFDEWEHYRKPDIIKKNVGDFRNWKNHDSYQKAFELLLRDLKADGRVSQKTK
jgi:hypothetical protein